MKDVGKYITGMWIQITADTDHNSTHSANETKKTYYKGVPCNETIGDISHHTPQFLDQIKGLYCPDTGNSTDFRWQLQGGDHNGDII